MSQAGSKTDSLPAVPFYFHPQMKVQILDKTFVPYISQDEIEAAVKRLTHQMNEELKDACPLFVCILKGAVFFFADLMENIDIPHNMTFFRISSYTGTQSSGNVRAAKPFPRPVEGRTVVIVEDIVETGNSMHFLRTKLLELGAKEVRIAALFFKPGKCKKELTIDYCGFEITDEFIVGYGLDYCEQGRELPSIYQLAPEDGADEGSNG